MFIQGYGSIRGDFGTKPLLQASGISTFTILTLTGDNSTVQNLSFDGATLTSSRGLNSNCNNSFVYNCSGLNCTNNAFTAANNGNLFHSCSATGCSTAAAFVAQSCFACEAYSNTFTGFAASAVSIYTFCMSYNNSGASSDGFTPVGAAVLTNCIAYNNGRDGVRAASVINLMNFIAEANTGVGINANTQYARVVNAFVYNNTGGNTSLSSGSGRFSTGIITGTTSAFVNAAGGNFALNNTAAGGAAW